jgi:UV DNA damage endonuclease
MKIGYPCIDRTIGCQGARTFRLRSYSDERLVDAVRNNLNCLDQVVRFNDARDLRFFRITSDLVPFASHPVCTFNWQAHFAVELAESVDIVARDPRFLRARSADESVDAQGRNAPEVVAGKRR